MIRSLVCFLAAGLCLAGDVVVPSQHLQGANTDITVTKLPDDSSANPKVAASGTYKGASISGSGILQLEPDGTWVAVFDMKTDGDGVDIIPVGWKLKLKLKANPDDDDGDGQEEGGELGLDGTPWGKGSVPLKH